MKNYLLFTIFSMILIVDGFAQIEPSAIELRVIESIGVLGDCGTPSNCINGELCFNIQMRIDQPGWTLDSYNIWVKYDWIPGVFVIPHPINYLSDAACFIFREPVLDNDFLQHHVRVTGVGGNPPVHNVTPDVWTPVHEVCFTVNDFNNSGSYRDDIENQDICAGGIDGGGNQSTITIKASNNSSITYTEEPPDLSCLTLTPLTLTCLNNQLPIELLYFEGVKIDDKVRLDWKTETEINNDYFDVQRSVDGLNFSSIGQVQGAGTTTEPQAYQLWDEALPNSEFIYYRLKQVDFDGTFSYSDIVVIQNSKLLSDDMFDITPNPADDVAYIQYDFSEAEHVELSLYSTSGQLLSRASDEALANTQNSSLTLDIKKYPMGMYIVELIVDDKQMVQKLNISR